MAVGCFNSDVAFDVGVGEPARDISPGTNKGEDHPYFGQRRDAFGDGFEFNIPALSD